MKHLVLPGHFFSRWNFRKWDGLKGNVSFWEVQVGNQQEFLPKIRHWDGLSMEVGRAG